VWHIGRAASSVNNPNGGQVVSASPIRITGKNADGQEHEVPRALSVEEIKKIQGWYHRAALNAMEAGFDGVEIHSANGYLLDQFINSNSNQRTDEYGGSVENRARFSLEVLDTVVDAVGAQRAAIRFSPGEGYQDMADENVVETWSYLTSQIQKKHPNLSYLHMIQARAAVHYDKNPGASMTPPDTLERYRQIWKGPFISASGFSNATDYAIELAEKTGNLIAFGRVFLANPDLPERLRNGYPVNRYNRTTFYRHDAIGYTDYPFYEEAANKI
jgi:2,4-dienoyl-CoA reductase-like NADH-dependent reductase (Old Yellow Enzyme family)